MISRIREDLKTAMKEKNTVQRDVLKMVLNKANMIAKDAKIETPTDEMVISAIKKENKQLQDTIDILEKNDKTDSELYAESKQKMSILNGYLPAQLDEETLRREILGFLVTNGIDMTNRGMIMKAVMPAFKDKADGKLINQVVTKILK